MSELFARDEDLERCQRSFITKLPITITGLNTGGELSVFTGIVQRVETGQNRYDGYPLRVTITK